MISHGISLTFGVCEKLPLRGFPEGKAKIIMRQEEFIKIFVRSDNSFSGYYVKEVEGFWEPDIKFVSNEKEII